jgi:hypothetical protein
MRVQSPFRQPAMIEMHLPGGFTRVVLYDLAHGEHRLDIPTDLIPAHLRQLGTRFTVIAPRFTPEALDTVEVIRDMCQQVRVEELNG